MTNGWIYNNEPIDEKVLDKFFGFVYSIDNTVTGKRYIGKKRFKFYKSKKLKTKKHRKKVVMESDWREYFGSSEELLNDVEKLGADKFKRTILRLCKSKGECSYWELWYQMTNHVLLNPHTFYNSYVGARIHRKHLMIKKEE